jgi:hypothetical protein
MARSTRPCYPSDGLIYYASTGQWPQCSSLLSSLNSSPLLAPTLLQHCSLLSPATGLSSLQHLLQDNAPPPLALAVIAALTAGQHASDRFLGAATLRHGGPGLAPAALAAAHCDDPRVLGALLDAVPDFGADPLPGGGDVLSLAASSNPGRRNHAAIVALLARRTTLAACAASHSPAAFSLKISRDPRGSLRELLAAPRAPPFLSFLWSSCPLPLVRSVLELAAPARPLPGWRDEDDYYPLSHALAADPRSADNVLVVRHLIGLYPRAATLRNKAGVSVLALLRGRGVLVGGGGEQGGRHREVLGMVERAVKEEAER